MQIKPNNSPLRRTACKSFANQHATNCSGKKKWANAHLF
jgi:hypothetical protein